MKHAIATRYLFTLRVLELKISMAKAISGYSLLKSAKTMAIGSVLVVLRLSLLDPNDRFYILYFSR